MKKSIFIVMVGAFLFTSCQNKTNAPQTENVEPTEENVQVLENEESEALESTSEMLNLNEGEKWIINKEMEPHVKEGEALIKNYLDENQDDYLALAEELTEANNRLIKSCTMKGESHDQLHNWLHPHLELTKSLKEESDDKKAQELVLNLKESYDNFHRYFQ